MSSTDPNNPQGKQETSALPNWALVVPMANEEADFAPFIREVFKELEAQRCGKIYLVADRASKDRTLELCQRLAQQDSRFVAIWAPDNKNLAEAYLRGYREAYSRGHDYILEMDAGLSHDPHSIPLFLARLSDGISCAWGSRFIDGGSMKESTPKRIFLSKGGTRLANLLLGTRLQDMTSGFQGFPRAVVALFMNYPLKSTAHFYQTELRYLLRKYPSVEIPIQYKAPSPRVSGKSIINSVLVLLYYFLRRITFRPVGL